ncbi:MAG: beta-lactamase family protein [Thermoanaerobaculia bacterium]|nr:beta-lactamase family protein [Thermoanaerobaculia bacterium]
MTETESSDRDSVNSSLPNTTRALEASVATGWNLGAQFYLSLNGVPVASEALGEADHGVPMREDSLSLWLSATKPITAVAIAQQWEQGRIALDDPVADILPEFSAGGKEAITLRHLLTHTGGFRILRFGWPDQSWDEIVSTLCATRKEPRWIPGHKAGYHMASSWFILGELVKRLDGRSFSSYVREEIFEPLGMKDSWIGMPRDVFVASDPRIVRTFDSSSTPPTLQAWHDERHVVGCSPGGNGRGPVRELGRFYEMLLAGGQLDGRRILDTPTIEALTARHRVGLFDHTFRHVMDWGLGIIPNSAYIGDTDLPYHYGPYASMRTFGHAGYRSTLAFCDPEIGLVLTAAFNGTPSEDNHRRRSGRLIEAVYQDLGFATDANATETAVGAESTTP